MDREPGKVGSGRRRVWLLLAALVLVFTAWLFWPYPDSDPVLRAFVTDLRQNSMMILSSVDATGAVSYRVGEEPISLPDNALCYTYTTAAGETWNEIIPVLSSTNPDGVQAVQALLNGIVSERPNLWERSTQSARRRVSTARHLFRYPSSVAVREMFGDDRTGRLGCLFSPDFEVRDVNNESNRMLLCLGCLEVRRWYGGKTDWAYFGMEVRDRYLAFAKDQGMEVSAKWREAEE